MINGSINRLYGRPRDTSFSRLSLRFRDPLVERQFHQSYVSQSATLNRGYMLVGLLAYLTYSVLDFLVLTDELRTVLWIRSCDFCCARVAHRHDLLAAQLP